MVGFYHEFENADKAVRENAGDIHETCYEYALIEEVEPGVYPTKSGTKRWLYKATGKYPKYPDISYEPVEFPKIMEHVYGIGIG